MSAGRRARIGAISIERSAGAGRRRRREGRARGVAAARPTAGKVRDALFNSLGTRVIDADVLDLFAGTGALGLEALRRGARSALFVERHKALAAQIRAEVRRLQLEGRVQVWAADVAGALRRLATERQRFDLILFDPPYGLGLLETTVEGILAGRLLRTGGLMVAEGHWRDAPVVRAPLTLAREARYGETALWFLAVEHPDAGDEDRPRRAGGVEDSQGDRRRR